MKRILPFTFLLLTLHTFAQEPGAVFDRPYMWKGRKYQTKDSTSLLYALKTGEAMGRFRYFSSWTWNEGALSDYYANAIGGAVRYETARFHNFQFALSGLFTMNVGSSDMTKPDPTTGQLNRYEIGLFDLTDPTNKRSMAQVEELYLKYNFKKGRVILGRQFIHTPLVNLQDGRMHGNSVSGIWTGYAPNSKWKLEGGWLWGIFPRSTNRWYNVGQSIGLYPNGVNPDGTKGNYGGNVKSAGIGVVSAVYQPIKSLEIQVWNYLLENVQNSVFTQALYKPKVGAKTNLIVGGQFIRQDALNAGGNADQSLTYMPKGSKAMTFGGKLGAKTGPVEYTLNYNRITKHGRYLFPREWGRDPFFTFMPRERNDGFGDVHAFVFSLGYNPPKNGFSGVLGAGYFELPDVKNTALNKYGMPSYYQINLDLKYEFNKAFKGLELQFLVVAKLAKGNTYDNPRFVLNKVNMLHTNLVLNYYF